MSVFQTPGKEVSGRYTEGAERSRHTYGPAVNRLQGRELAQEVAGILAPLAVGLLFTICALHFLLLVF